MIQRVLILCLWTLIAFPEYSASVSYKSSANLLSKKLDGVDERQFRGPGSLFVNDEDDDEQESNNSYLQGRIGNNNKRNSEEIDLNDFGGAAADVRATDSKDTSEIYQSREDSKNRYVLETKRGALHVNHEKRVLRRRKGPTLSVVNPLEILRQKLMLEMARRRIQENQQQIVANADFLENLGKRSSDPGRQGNWPKAPDEANGGRRKPDGKVDEYSR